MGKKEDIALINDRLKDANKILDQAYDDQSKLCDQKNLLIKDLILEEKMLAGTEWLLVLDKYSNNIELEYITSRHEGKVDEISTLLGAGYHDLFELQPGIEIRFDDNDVLLTFKNSTQVYSFVKKNEMKLDCKTFISKVEALRNQLQSLEELASFLPMELVDENL